MYNVPSYIATICYACNESTLWQKRNDALMCSSIINGCALTEACSCCPTIERGREDREREREVELTSFHLTDGYFENVLLKIPVTEYVILYTIIYDPHVRPRPCDMLYHA